MELNITLGNVLTIIIILFVAAVQYITLVSRVAKMEGRHENIQKDIDTLFKLYRDTMHETIDLLKSSMNKGS